MYDFDAEAPTWDLWKLLPGDTLIVTCSYRPLPDRDIVGGWSMNDEMCVLVLGIAPELPNVDYAVGYMMKDGDPFLGCYMGLSDGRLPETLEYEFAQFEPNADSFYQPMADESNCELVIRDQVQLPKTTFASPEIPAQTIVIFIFASGFIVSQWPCIQRIDSERERRNTTIYVIHLVFSLVALPIVLTEVIRTFPATDTYDAATGQETWKLARCMILVQSLLYLVELFYRIQIRWTVVLHHSVAVLLVIFIYATANSTFGFVVCVKVGMQLTLMAVTEQPFYLTLLLKNFGYAHRPWWPPLCRVSGWMFIVCKLAVIGMVATVLAQSGSGADASWKLGAHSFSEWFDMGNITKQTFTIVLSLAMGLLLFIQVYIGHLMLSLANKYDSKIRKGCSGIDHEDNKSDDVVDHDKQPHQDATLVVTEKVHNNTEVVEESDCNENSEEEEDDTPLTAQLFPSDDTSVIVKLSSGTGNTKMSVSSLVVGDVQEEVQQPVMDHQHVANAALAFAV